MATIVTRETTQTDGTSPKGSPLTNAEVDTNFINLNDDKVEVSGAIIFQAKAGEALAKGDVVYVSGVSGNEPVVSKADADDASKMPAYGLAEADATLNAAVNVVTFGTLYDLDTSSFSAGDTVYVSTTAGAITTTAPTGESSLLQNIGTVIRSHASAGSIKVGGAGRTNATPNLDDGNVFIGNASNQAEARALTGDDISGGTITSFASTGIDDNATSTAVTIDSSQDVTFTSDAKFPDNGKAIFGAGSDLQIYHDGTNSWVKESNATGSFFVDAANLYLRADDGQAYLAAVKDSYVRLYHDDSVKLETTSTGIDVTGDVNSDSVTTGTFTSTGIDDNATSTAITIDSSENVGIGTASPSTSLDVVRAGAMPLRVQSTSGTECQINMVNTGGNVQLEAHSGNFTIDADNVGIGTTSPLNKFVVSEGTGQHGIELAPGTTSYIQAYDRAIADYGDLKIDAQIIQFGTDNGTERMRIDSSGRVGIGVSSPAEMLDINEGSTATYIRMRNATSTTGYIGYGTSASATDMTFWTNGSKQVTLDGSGNVGIGTTSPGRTLDVNGIIRSDSSSGAFALGGNSSTPIEGAAIHRPANDTMAFVTASTERMRIDSSGNVGLGTTDIGARLSVRSAASASITNVLDVGNAQNAAGTGHGAMIRLHCTTDENRGVAIASSSSTNYATDNSMLFYTSASSTLTERMRILSGGGITFNGDTATANALDDYEEGTWTPTIGSGTASFTNAMYTKIGRIVTATVFFQSVSDQSSGTALAVSGLPYASNSNTFHASVGLSRFFNRGGGTIVAYMGGSSNTINFYALDTGADYLIVRHSDLNNSFANYYVSITYQTT